MSLVDQVKDLARGRWADVLVSLGVDGSLLHDRHGPCPGCGGDDRFRFDDRDGNGTWICGGGGNDPEAGDGIALLMHVRGCEFKEALKVLADRLGAVDEERYRPQVYRRLVRPAAKKEKPAAMDRERVARVCAGAPKIDRKWVRERSPVDPATVGPREFFEALYEPGERVLVAMSAWSPGDYLWWVGHGPYRLSRKEGEAARPARMPRGGKGGVLMLANPVDGQWHDTRGGRRRNRRCADAVTAWRYVVVESDLLTKEEWLQVLCQAPLRIAAMFTTGNKSVHALVRVDAKGREEWKDRVLTLASLFGPLGGDVSAAGGLPMSRYPFALRYGDFKKDEEGRVQHVPYAHPKRQALWYLNPDPDPVALVDMERRTE